MLNDFHPIRLFGLSVDEIYSNLNPLGVGVHKFTAQQIYEWLYSKRVWKIEEWTNLSKNLRECLLKRRFTAYPLEPETYQCSTDGVEKYLFRLMDGGLIETVIIPDIDRVTLCLSSQVGCSHACFFCATARQGYKRNLTCHEILSQYAALSRYHDITNIVYMGMGEPFSNWNNVKESINILKDKKGFNFSSKRITVSSVGVFPALKDFIEDMPCNLALSLHSPFPNERKRLMPIENVYPIEDILEYLKKVTISKPIYRLSIEYIVFKGVNHSSLHAIALTKLLHGLKVRINLIPYHPIGNIFLESASIQEMIVFQKKLQKRGLITTIRRSRGMGIDAACGMLSTKKISEHEQEKNLDY